MTPYVKARANSAQRKKPPDGFRREAPSAPCGAALAWEWGVPALDRSCNQRRSADYFVPLFLLAFFLLPFRLPFFFVAFFAVPLDAFFFLRVAMLVLLLQHSVSFTLVRQAVEHEAL